MAPTMRKFLLPVVLTLALSTTHAAEPLLTLRPGDRTINARGSPLTLSIDGLLAVPDRPAISMTTIGGGLRRKRVLLLGTVDVYVAQFLVDAAGASRFVKTAAGSLDSTDQIDAVAMHLTFLRDLSPRQLTDGLNEAMRANGYNVKDSPDLQALSRAMIANGPVRRGTVGVLAAIRVDAQNDLVVYQGSSGRISSVGGRPGLKHALMSAWLGKPSDEQLRALRDDILGVRPER